MRNFEYIISSLPFLTTDYKYGDGQGFHTVLEEIRENLDAADKQTLDLLLQGFDEKKLGADFYARALQSPLRFVREYFRFDLNLRNAKVRYLNRMLDRPEELDTISGNTEEAPFASGEFEESEAVHEALQSDGLLEREKALDAICWEKIDSLESFHDFDLTAVLAYVSKLHIVDRWLSLDGQKGRELFHKLVQEVKGSRLL